MQKICLDIINEFNIRFKTNPFIDAVHATYGIAKENSEEDLKNLLISFIMKHLQKEEFIIETILLEYKLYNDFVLNYKDIYNNMSVEKSTQSF